MIDFNSIEKTPENTLDTALIKLCRRVEAKRARTVIDHILQYGIITNEELSDIYGYNHPPRAIQDVKDNGIPLIRHNVTSPKTGRRMGAYTFGDISKIKKGRIGGRNAFPKKFRQEIIALYGAKDAITGVSMDGRYLQIDHRVPYEVAGDDNDTKHILNPDDFMLLDASSNRAKSWSCEHCDNFLNKHNSSICKLCFWASPENYRHIAEALSRRVDIVWTGEDEANEFDSLKQEADLKEITVANLIKERLRK